MELVSDVRDLAVALLGVFVLPDWLMSQILIAFSRALAVLGLIVKGAVGSKFALLETLNRATPLIFTGLAVAVAFRAKLWNIGAEGHFLMGALGASIMAVQLVDAQGPWVLPLVLRMQ